MRSVVPVLVLATAVVSGMLLAQGEGKYAGVDKCRMCHPDVYNGWSKTAHATSFDLLVNVGQEKNPECLPCHTTGYGKNGYADEATTPGLHGTTCEACHGSGADHADNMGDKTKIVRTPSAEACAACHQQNSIHPKKA
jgi:hypothetical protein